MNSIKFSVVIPLYNEEENIAILHKELIYALKGYIYELIYVNDGSTDSTYLKLKKEIKNADMPLIKIINLHKNFGQSYAFKAGLNNAESSLIVFIDGDLQNDPKDIPKLLEKIDEGYDLVQGVRLKRLDPFFKKVIPARIANLILRFFCGSKFKDIGCSLKVFKKAIVSDIIFHNGIHRVLPLYLQLKGAHTAEININHRSRIFGKTKYGLSRIFNLIYEIVMISFSDKYFNKLSSKVEVFKT
jgi:glycosyltransferase involved in cell wall biosynthesis